MSNMVRKIFVTGATSGIGEAIAQAFQAEGAQVIATGATDLEVQNAFKKSANVGIDFRVLDVRDLSAVQAMVGALSELDVVVNCAGVIQRALELEPEAFARTVDINLNGTMRVCSAAREGLKARRGCIVNTASMLSFFGGGLVPGYSASKGGVAQLTKSLAIAYADDGIRVNAVAPGWIATPSPVCDRRCIACRRWLLNFLNKKDLNNLTRYAAFGLGADCNDQFIRKKWGKSMRIWSRLSTN